MAKNEKPLIDVGAAVANGIYSDVKIVHNQVQPFFILHKDSIRNFFHEKYRIFEMQGRLLGLVGITLSLIASLLTATFNDWHGIKGSLIEACFVVSTVISTLFTLKDFSDWWKNKGNMSVDQLSDELGRRGSVIQPENKNGSHVSTPPSAPADATTVAEIPEWLKPN